MAALLIPPFNKARNSTRFDISCMASPLSGEQRFAPDPARRSVQGAPLDKLRAARSSKAEWDILTAQKWDFFKARQHTPPPVRPSGRPPPSQANGWRRSAPRSERNHGAAPPPPRGVLHGTPHSWPSCGTGCCDALRPGRSVGPTSTPLQTGRDASPSAGARRTRRGSEPCSISGRPPSVPLNRFVPLIRIPRTGCLLSPDHRSLESLQPAPPLRGSLAPRDIPFASGPHKTLPRRGPGFRSFRPPDAGAIPECRLDTFGSRLRAAALSRVISTSEPIGTHSTWHLTHRCRASAGNVKALPWSCPRPRRSSVIS